MNPKNPMNPMNSMNPNDLNMTVVNISTVLVVLMVGYIVTYLLLGNIWGGVFVLIVTSVVLFYYVFNVNILSFITYSLKKGLNELDEDEDADTDANELNEMPIRETERETNVPQLVRKPQVFHLPGNQYSYGDAKAVCSAYGARLATYGEIEESYNNSGEWCSYGWSDDQMALYPTQTDTYNQLQKIKGHENDCGRPGINGGFMNNPQLKFGVNCYGYKPRMTQQDEYLMANKPIYPKTQQDIDMDNRVKYWKTKLSSLLVSPFNHNTWSRL